MFFFWCLCFLFLILLNGLSLFLSGFCWFLMLLLFEWFCGCWMLAFSKVWFGRDLVMSLFIRFIDPSCFEGCVFSFPYATCFLQVVWVFNSRGKAFSTIRSETSTSAVSTTSKRQNGGESSRTKLSAVHPNEILPFHTSAECDLQGLENEDFRKNIHASYQSKSEELNS